MHQPHVVILESRRFPNVTEQWYNIAAGALSQQNVSFSRVTVPAGQDLPIALSLLFDATRNPNRETIRIPDGYLVLGVNYKGDISEHNHTCVWEKLLFLAADQKVPYSSIFIYEREAADLQTAGVSYTQKVQSAVLSLVDLIALRHQLINPYSAAA